MKTKLTDFIEKKTEDQLAQEINSIEEINNPVIKEEENNNTPDPVITEDPIEEIKEEEIPPTPIIERPKNNVRIMDGNFPF